MNKYKKALEIIKKKKVNMISLLSSIGWHNPSHYNDSVGCPIGCELTQEEYDFLKNIFFEQPNKGDRKYVAYFKKYYLYPDGRKYQDNAHFCISSLETDAIKRPFENDNIVVEELKVTERLTGKVIYQGTSYDKYLKVIRGLDNE